MQGVIWHIYCNQQKGMIRGDDGDAELSTFGDEGGQIVLREVLHFVAEQGERLTRPLGQGFPRQRRKLQLRKEQVTERMFAGCRGQDHTGFPK